MGKHIRKAKKAYKKVFLSQGRKRFLLGLGSGVVALGRKGLEAAKRRQERKRQQEKEAKESKYRYEEAKYVFEHRKDIPKYIKKEDSK